MLAPVIGCPKSMLYRHPEFISGSHRFDVQQVEITPCGHEIVLKQVQNDVAFYFLDTLPFRIYIFISIGRFILILVSLLSLK